MMRQLIVFGAAVVVVAACGPLRHVPTPPVDFDGYTAVNPAHYFTFEAYGSSGVQFTTSAGTRAGQKIFIPGNRGGTRIDDAVCAAGPDDLLICEVEKMELDDGRTHGLILSPHGSNIIDTKS